MFDLLVVIFFDVTATTERTTYRNPLSLHYAHPMSTRRAGRSADRQRHPAARRHLARVHCPGVISSGMQHFTARKSRKSKNPECRFRFHQNRTHRSEEHTSELQSLLCISYAVFSSKIKQ